MYRLGSKVYTSWRHKKAFLISFFVAAGLIGLIFWYLQAENKTVIVNPSAAITTKVNAPENSNKLFKETDFNISLPNSWASVEHLSSPYNLYIFKNTTKYLDARSLDIYVDTIPTVYPVNKLLPLTVVDNHIVAGTLSENCTNFTGPISTTPNQPVTSKAQISKWEDVSFLCDLANYNRNVVGTGSIAGVNKVILSGKSGQHSFFFVYTDETPDPEYQTLMDAMNSFIVN